MSSMKKTRKALEALCLAYKLHTTSSKKDLVVRLMDEWFAKHWDRYKHEVEKTVQTEISMTYRSDRERHGE